MTKTGLKPKDELSSILVTLAVNTARNDGWKVADVEVARLSLIELMEEMVPEAMKEGVTFTAAGWNGCRQTMLERIKELK